MFKLAPYFAGGLAALVAMDFAPPVKSAIDQWTGTARPDVVQVVNKIDRAGKGDRIVPLHPAALSFGRASLMRQDRAPQDITIRAKSTAGSGATEIARKPAAHAPKLPVGCDPAFSPLAASASLNFAGRCVS